MAARTTVAWWGVVTMAVAAGVPAPTMSMLAQGAGRNPAGRSDTALVDGPPLAQPAAGPQCGGRSSNPRTPCPGDVSAMIAALPAAAPARPARPRKVLVLARAAGYVHSSIPLAARTVEELGRKTGAWTTTISYDAADIDTKTLAQYDAIVLASTTGHFLDDEKDPAATAARRAAFLAFVRGGKGLAAIHAATDSYHRRRDPQAPAASVRGPDDQIGTWPEFNTLLGGFFKYHWNDGQVITYTIDDPGSPLTAPFAGKAPFVVADETYTFGREVYTRRNLRVLTSVDMAAMSDEDKAKEQYPRPDRDHPLSWIRAEQKGRVFYMSHGHNEKVYANPVLLQHLLAGIQYATGDLKADDRPSESRPF